MGLSNSQRIENNLIAVKNRFFGRFLLDEICDGRIENQIEINLAAHILKSSDIKFHIQYALKFLSFA